MSTEQPALDQYELVQDLVAEDRWWLIILDAARWDYFSLAVEYLEDTARPLDGDLKRADNGGIGFTETWFAEMLAGDYDAVCINPQPIWTFQGGSGYDERRHFALVPGPNEYEWDADLATVTPETVREVALEYTQGDVAEIMGPSMAERLANLGYVDDAEQLDAATESGVIRFIQPHPPFRQLVDLTKTRANRDRAVAQAVAAEEVTVEAVRAAYRDNLEWGLATVQELVDDLEGRVVVTADHGEALGEDGLWFHHEGVADLEVVRMVPWLEVDG